MTTGRRVYVRGRVQGVAFRWRAREKALALGVCGWVRNLADGRVEVWIEGDADPVRSMLKWLQHGPTHARVAGCEVTDVEPRNFSQFRIEPQASS